MPWQTVEAVGDQSAYVSSIAAHVRSTIPLIRDNLSPARKYFVNFCHKLAKYVSSCWLNPLMWQGFVCTTV